jgi:hypothetical protein
MKSPGETVFRAVIKYYYKYDRKDDKSFRKKSKRFLSGQASFGQPAEDGYTTPCSPGRSYFFCCFSCWLR